MTTFEPDWRRPQRIAESIDALLTRGIASLEGLSESPRADVLLLLGYAAGRSREWILAHGDASAAPQESLRFSALCARRALGVPIAYLLGTAHFYGREFLVNESVLVPRPETERLVDEALLFIGNDPMQVLDIGTGSGAIACTIAAATKATVDATDISFAAIELAAENARRLSVADRCTFYQGDLIDPLRANRYDVIVANLPYIPTNDLPQRPEAASYEPHIALDGGPTGLTHYERLLPALPSRINEGGVILLEAAPPTIFALVEMLCHTLPNFAVSVGYDYSGLARYVKAHDVIQRE